MSVVSIEHGGRLLGRTKKMLGEMAAAWAALPALSRPPVLEVWCVAGPGALDHMRRLARKLHPDVPFKFIETRALAGKGGA